MGPITPLTDCWSTWLAWSEGVNRIQHQDPHSKKPPGGGRRLVRGEVVGYRSKKKYDSRLD
jgi:hypothetical protein